MSPERGCSYKERQLPHGWVQTMIKHSLVVRHHRFRQPDEEIIYTSLPTKEINRAVENKISHLTPYDISVDVEHQVLRIYEKKVRFLLENDIKTTTLMAGVTNGIYISYLGIMGVNKNEEPQLVVVRFDHDGQILDSNYKGWGKVAFGSAKIQRDYKFLGESLKPFAAENLTKYIQKISAGRRK